MRFLKKVIVAIKLSYLSLVLCQYREFSKTYMQNVEPTELSTKDTANSLDWVQVASTKTSIHLIVPILTKTQIPNLASG